MSGDSTWTDERTEQLKTLWQEGCSASDVARVLGGVTRNGVISKLKRLGLSDDLRPLHRRKVRKQLPRSPPAAPINTEPISMLTVEFEQCRFPLWEDLDQPGDMLVCGAKATRGSYCEPHAVRCYGKIREAS